MTTLSSANQTAAAANPYRAALFVTVSFASYTLRVWSGAGPKLLGGNTYTGAGGLGSISAIPEPAATSTSGFDAERLELRLTGLNVSLAAEVRDFAEQGAAVEIVEAQLDANDAPIDGTYSLWVGQVDTMAFEIGTELTIVLTCENFLAWMFRPVDGRRRSNEDQQDLFAGDLFFEFVGKLPNAIPWGVAVNAQGAAPPPGRATFNQLR